MAIKEAGPLLTFREAGEIAGLDYRTISKGVRDGQVPTLKIGGRIWISRQAFGKFLAGELTTG